ncbi:MAG: hypothetical protein PUA47_00475 [Bacteroidales bacterium]|nr:hypothetical protein [Bacteroidales bacterium]
MRFRDIPGNDSVKRALVNMADSGRVAHAMLFYENDGCGAFALAVAYLQYLNCPHRADGDSCGVCPTCNKISKLIHPDVHFVYPVNTGSKSGSLASKDVTSDTYLKYFRELACENPYFLESNLSEAIGIEGKVGNISVSEARNITDALSLTAVENGYKAVVFLQPEKMNAATANKLLKIVEEPPEKTIFLFITHHPDNVMQTIFSRCQSSRVLPLDRDEVAEILTERFGVSPEDAAAEAGTCGGSVGVALDRLRSDEDRQRYLDLFADLIDAALGSDLLAALDAGDAVAALDSREKQKAFCTFAADCIRKVFMIQRNLPQIAYLSEQEKDYLTRTAARLPGNFPERMLPLLDKTVMLLERNVNQKILFCDLADRVFLNLK